MISKLYVFFIVSQRFTLENYEIVYVL